MRPVTVGIIGAGNVIWAYLQALDRLAPRGLARLDPCARGVRKLGQIFKLGVREFNSLRIQPRFYSPTRMSCSSSLRLKAIPHLCARRWNMANTFVVEKPAAATRCEAQQLVQQAQERGLHLMCAPFVQLAPTFRALWGRIEERAIGKVHSARALYGNAGSTWSRWYHDGSVSPLAEVGIYNLKSLTAVLGPVAEVQSAETLVVPNREIAGDAVGTAGADVSHVLLWHVDGGLSSLVAGHCIQRYRRPGLEFYGTEGTANLLGDDWDPRGFEIWRNSAGCWEEFEPVDPTWLWADGLAEIVHALAEKTTTIAQPRARPSPVGSHRSQHQGGQGEASCGRAITLSSD